MADMVPSLNACGTFVLAPPFDTILLPNVPYTCIAIREIADVVDAGIDPFGVYYSPQRVDAEKYQRDLAAGVVIVSLQASTGAVVHIPSSYIQSYPRFGGVPYTTVALVVPLSALQKTTNLSYLMSQVQDLVRDTIGVTTTAQVLTISADTLVDAESADSIEAARLALIKNSPTDRASRLHLEETVRQQADKIKQLETYILSLPKT